MSIATEQLSIATEPRVPTTPRRTLEHRTLERRTLERRTISNPGSRRRRTQQHVSMERRRQLGIGVVGGGAHRNRPSCVDAAHEPQRISWLSAVVGIVATAAVILGFVAMANLRAASLESASPGVATPGVATQQGVAAGHDGVVVGDLASVGK